MNVVCQSDSAHYCQSHALAWRRVSMDWIANQNHFIFEVELPICVKISACVDRASPDKVSELLVAQMRRSLYTCFFQVFPCVLNRRELVFSCDHSNHGFIFKFLHVYSKSQRNDAVDVHETGLRGIYLSVIPKCLHKLIERLMVDIKDVTLLCDLFPN